MSKTKGTAKSMRDMLIISIAVRKMILANTKKYVEFLKLGNSFSQAKDKFDIYNMYDYFKKNRSEKVKKAFENIKYDGLNVAFVEGVKYGLKKSNKYLKKENISSQVFYVDDDLNFEEMVNIKESQNE